MPLCKVRAALFSSTALSIAALGYAHAQPVAQASPDEDVLSMEEVVVVGRYGASTAVTGTKMEIPLLEIPQSIATVSEALIQERRPASLNEALFNVSGVADSGSRRGFDNLIIRGVGGSFSIYLDGLRVERGNFNVPQETFGLERIEVLKGPGSVLYGQGSLGGIINQVSRLASPERTAEAEIMVGSFGTTQVGIDFGGAVSDTVSARLVGLYRDLQESVDFNGRERTYLAPSLTWAGGATRLTLIGNYTRDRNEGAYVGVPVEGTILPNPNGRIDRRRYIGEPSSDTVEADRYQIGYQLEHEFGNGWTARQTLRFADTDVLSRATFSSGLQADLRTLNRSSAIFALSDQSTAIDSNLQYTHSGARFENTFLIGADLLFQSVDSTFNFTSFPPIDIYAPVYGGPRGPLFAIQSYTEENTLYGLYLQNQLKLGDKLTVLVGARFDGAEIDNTNRLTSTRRSQKDEDVTFRIGVTYELAKDVAVYASYSEAFNPNFGLNAFGDPFEPETGTQYEAGLKTDFADGRIRTTLAAFQLVRDNVLVAFPQFPGTQVQTGQQRSQGFEFDGAIDLTDNWRLTTAYAYTDVEVRRDTNPALIGDSPINAPAHQASLWTSYDIPLRRGVLTLSGGGRFVGEREGTLPNSYTLPNYTIADAAVAYRQANWRLQANIYNLFDEDYILSASPTGQRSVLPGEPLTARLTLGISF